MMILFPFLFLSSTAIINVNAMQLRIASWNLRYDSLPDSLTISDSLSALPNPLQEPTQYLGEAGKELPWSTRRLRVAQTLLSENVDLIGFQEALLRQVEDLQELLGTDWAWIGLGRDDGVAAGEFSPLFYKTSKFRLLSNDSFWTSQTPFEPSKYPDAGSFRIATAARFLSSSSSSSSSSSTSSSSTNTTFSVLNTHFDNQSDAQRQLAGSMLRYRAHYEVKETDCKAVIVMGDFNSETTGPTSGGYDIATGVQEPVEMNSTFTEKFSTSDPISQFHLVDLRGETPKELISNTFATFTGFTPPDVTEDWARIDFVFGGSDGGWNAEGYKVLDVMGDDGVLASDHRPVIVDISI